MKKIPGKPMAPDPYTLAEDLASKDYVDQPTPPEVKLTENMERLSAVELELETPSALGPMLTSLAYTKTGFEHFDELTQGMCPGDLTVLGSSPDSLRTDFALNVARRAAGDINRKDQRPVLFFPLAQGPQASLKRAICMERYLDEPLLSQAGILNNDKFKEEWSLGLDNVRRKNIFTFKHHRASLTQINQEVSSFGRNNVNGIVIIDSLQHIGFDGPDVGKSREERTEMAGRELRALANEHGLHILLLSEHKRQANPNSVPKIDAYPELEGIADTVLHLYSNSLALQTQSELKFDTLFTRKVNSGKFKQKEIDIEYWPACGAMEPAGSEAVKEVEKQYPINRKQFQN